MAQKNVPRSTIDPTLPFASAKSATKLETEYADAYNAWTQDDNPTTRQQLLTTIQPAINTAVKTFGGGSPSPAVLGQAKLMALEAARSYKPDRGSLGTHVISHLRGLQRVSAQSQQIISIPERVMLDRRHLQEEEEQLRDQLGRDPSDMEIANASGLSLRRIRHIRSAKLPTNSGGFVDETGDVFDPASLVPGDNQAEDAWRQMVYYDLNDIDRAIMDFTLGSNGSPVLENREIARRLRISPGAVSQRKSKIQAMLDLRTQISPFRS